MRVIGALVLGAVVCGAGWLPAQEQPSPEKYEVKSGTRIPLVLVNSISTKTSNVGDRVYLQTSFPIAVNGRIVIPEGSYVTGTVTQVKQPGRIQGRGELYVRFDTLMLRNGVQRDFRGTVSAVDGSGDETLPDKEGKIEGEGTKGEDAGSVAGTATSGAAIGAGVGAAVGMIGVLLTRGSEVRLLRGTSLEMQLDRDLAFAAEETNFLGSPPPPPLPSPAPQPGGTPSRGTSSPLPYPLPRPY